VTETLAHAVPFTARVHPNGHPDRLAVIARLHGIPAPAIEDARILEIGCGEGGNLAAIAATLPKARIVGIDLSADRIATGGAALQAAGITNVDLRVADVTTTKRLGTFDYVFCHGLFSSVSSDTQDALLSFTARSLSPNGVAYLAYDTMPGWHALSAVREMLLFDARGIKEPGERVARAREYLGWLARGESALREAAAEIAAEGDDVLARKYLAPHHKPVHFHKLALRARRQGLAYLCETEPVQSADHDPGPRGVLARARSSDELMWAEQHYDFLVGRRFRTTLFCRRERDGDLVRDSDTRWIEDMFVTTRAEPIEPDANPRAPRPATFRAAAAEMTTSHPALKAAMLVLHENAPRAMPVVELVNAARERLGDAWTPADGDLLRQNLLRTFLSAMSIVELRVYAPPARAPGDKPIASPWARYGAEVSGDVANLRHERVHLDDVMRGLVRLLEGRLDRRGLMAAMTAMVGAGDDRETLDRALVGLGRASLLVG
jgi:SAM-dependent methyltransferase